MLVLLPETGWGLRGSSSEQLECLLLAQALSGLALCLQDVDLGRTLLTRDVWLPGATILILYVCVHIHMYVCMHVCDICMCMC